jgi:DNA polymerase-1
MEKVVWDFKSQYETHKNEHVYDAMVAEFLLSYGKHIPTQEAALKEYSVETLEELAEKQKQRFAELPKLETLYETVELPLTPVLWQMEKNGIFLDVACLKQVGIELGEAITLLENELKKEIGFEINLNSAIQVGNYLAEKAGVPLAKTKTGRYATNEQELAQHAAGFPIIEKLLKYRELAKLRSTYVESLTEKVDDEGRLHTTYHQVAVNTGRIASSNPNMQNIPVTSEFGLKIKSCFIAPPGKTLVSFDYSQQELRILAHLTGEEKLIIAFTEGRDVHKTTASILFNVEYDEVTKQQRSVAKTINFGIIYGMSAYGMSYGLGIPVEEAQKFIKTFFETYPKIKSYYDSYLKQGKADGYVETILGRRRNTFEYPGQKFIDNNLRRVLINYPIQGSAADLMKKAMVEIDKEILQKDPSIKLLLQIHDDLVFEVEKDEEKLKSFIKHVRETMCSVYPLSVPIEVDVKRGKMWGEMKEVKI